MKLVVACILSLSQGCHSGDTTGPVMPFPEGTVPGYRPATIRVMRLAPDTLVVGAAMTIEGEGMPTEPSQVSVSLGGVELSVVAASANRMVLQLPRVLPTCDQVSIEEVTIRVRESTQTFRVPVRHAARIVAQPGGPAVLLDALSAGCIELPELMAGEKGTYEITVLNHGSSLQDVVSFVLNGTGLGAVAGVVSTMTSRPAASRGQDAAEAVLGKASLVPSGDVGSMDASHASMLAQQMRIAIASGSPAIQWRVGHGTQTPRSALTRTPAVGDTLQMSMLLGSCRSGSTVKARVTYAGSRSIMLEDLAAPHAGTMDSSYRQLGREFDGVMYPLLAENVGDPLAMNALMGGDGRVTILVTRFVNDSAPGTSGYVNACNFYPRATFAASSQDEVIYLRAATRWETPEEWTRSMRATVVHEAKHLASFAGRLSRGLMFDELWLEEATARVAEELYARTFNGGGRWKGELGFSGSVQCELLQCDDRPLIMWKHFTALQRYLRRADSLSPLGAMDEGDDSFYASGWSLVRWILDHYADNESDWLRRLVSGGAGRGIEALTAMTNATPEDIVLGWQQWLRGAYMEGQQARHVASWDLSDMMRGLGELLPEVYGGKPVVAQRSFGDFRSDASQLAAFGAFRMLLVGSSNGGQLIGLRSPDGQPVPPWIVLSIRRLGN